MVKKILSRLVDGIDLDEEQAYEVACSIMDAKLSSSQIAALLVALRMKGETVAEITGFVRAMRDRVEQVAVAGDDVVDTCGTGGDGLGTFNVSTVCAFVCAGAGVRVAKHGNRSVSSRCGSVELLEALGVDAQMEPPQAARSIEELGLGFLFAPRYHKATRHAVEPRRAIGIRSIFNIVGPLTNPAGARRQLLGVFDAGLTEPLAQSLGRLGAIHSMVVHGADGLDEISISGLTRVSELREGKIETYDLDPGEYGFERRSLHQIAGGGPETNARIALEVLEGRPGPCREIVLLNAGAAIYVSGRAPDLQQGIALATDSIDSSRALAKLTAMREPAAPSHA